jgi:phosphoribosyl-ATP pyrophosphohydrolase
LSYNPENYIADAVRTAKDQPTFVVHDHERHGIQGIVGEVGELVEAFMDGTMTHLSVKDELGDLCWYMAILLFHHNLSFDSYYPKKQRPSLPMQRDLNWLLMKMTIHSAYLMDRIKKRDAYGKQFTWHDLRDDFFWLHNCVLWRSLRHQWMLRQPRRS